MPRCRTTTARSKVGETGVHDVLRPAGDLDVRIGYSGTKQAPANGALSTCGGAEPSRQQGFDLGERLRLGQLGEHVAQVGAGFESVGLGTDLDRVMYPSLRTLTHCHARSRTKYTSLAGRHFTTGSGMDWGTIGTIAGIQLALFAWLKWDISKLSDRLGIVERDVSWLRGRLDGSPAGMDSPPARG